MKLFKALFVLALALVVSAPAFAETQNVKVSGSIDAYWFYRRNYDLRDNNDSGAVAFTDSVQSGDHSGNSRHRSEGDDFFRTNTQIEVSADLTDNVSTVINIINQRDWNSTYDTEGSDASYDEFTILLDLAYVQMKEIFYSPLTLTIGRQDLWFGRGFVIGNNWRTWDTKFVTEADEYSVTTAFDAIRATLDFNPWTLDFVYSKIRENAHDPEDDIDLYIANINYKFAEYNAVAELYWITENDRGTLAFVSSDDDTRNNDTHTLGGRVQFDPISQITLGAELAYQFGNYRSPSGADVLNPERDRSAWAFDIFGTYRWDYTWQPQITVEYVHFSGEDNMGSGVTDEYNAWNFLYRGKYWTAYEDFREFVYRTGDGVDQSATTNNQFIQIKGSIKPLEDLLLEAAFTYIWTDEDVHTVPGDQSSPSRDDEIGWEIDTQVTYDYTEDVTFGILAAWFFPGDFYGNEEGDATATDIVSSVKVTF